jgi:hypothetical protein
MGCKFIICSCREFIFCSCHDWLLVYFGMVGRRFSFLFFDHPDNMMISWTSPSAVLRIFKARWGRTMSSGESGMSGGGGGGVRNNRVAGGGGDSTNAAADNSATTRSGWSRNSVPFPAMGLNMGFGKRMDLVVK